MKKARIGIINPGLFLSTSEIVIGDQQRMKSTNLVGLVLLSLVMSINSACQPINQRDSSATLVVEGTNYPFPNSDDVNKSSYPSPSTNDDLSITSTQTASAITIDTVSDSIKASIFSISLNKKIENTIIYLTKAVGENNDQLYPVLSDPRLSIGDIISTTDNDGAFIFQNIEPGNYFIVVQFPPYWTVVQISKDDPKPLLVKIGLDNNIDLGVVYIP